MTGKSYEVLLTRRFEKDLAALPLGVRKRLLIVLTQLSIDPYQGDQLRGVKIGQWKWRIGDYRIRYDIEGRKVILHAVKHRREIYRG